MSMTFYRGMLVTNPGGSQISLAWLAGRTLLGILLLAALVVERRIPVSREPGKEIAGATLIVGAVAYLTSVFYFMLPDAPKIHPGAFVSRPWTSCLRRFMSRQPSVSAGACGAPVPRSIAPCSSLRA